MDFFFSPPCMTDCANLCVVFLSPNLTLLKRDRRPVNLQWELCRVVGPSPPPLCSLRAGCSLKDNDFGVSAGGGMLFAAFWFAE